MKTKLIKICLPLLVVFFVTPAFARENIIDNAGLLNQQEKANLSQLIASAASAYNFDLVIVTVKNIDGSNPGEYADGFFKRNGYGLGQNRDGCLFLLVTESHDYLFCPSGRGIKILNPTAEDKLEGNVVKPLKEGDFFGAFRTFLLDWDEFLALDAKGRSYNFFHQWNLVLVIIAWVLSIVIGFSVVQVWKKGMDTVLPQNQAAAYMVPGSLVFNEKKDSFLYSRVSKTKLQKQTSSSVKGFSSSRSFGGKY
jgi:uncharacterized membrane protein YgcG